MKEDYYEKLLGIKTSGNEKWSDQFVHCHPYEPTSYSVLNILFEKYKLSDSDFVVDFGCGKGRLAFYLNYLFNSSVVGVEMSPNFYNQALDNKISYYKSHANIDNKINFHCCLAQDYKITLDDNIFYFFNPFSVQVFMKVIENILDSIEKKERPVKLILYYPSDDYTFYLENNTAFVLTQEILIPDCYEHDYRERFLVYELCYMI